MMCFELSFKLHLSVRGLLCILVLQVYVSSSQLDSDAIVAFVKCLASISLDELRDARAPRVFSLTKIVEISHFNMSRIR